MKLKDRFFLQIGVILMISLISLISCDEKEILRGDDFHRTVLVQNHGVGYDDPLNNCAECHGDDLKGGENGEVSCYLCHANMWDYYQTPHNIDLGGSFHVEGYEDPKGNNCTDCHGANLKDTTGDIACYDCHLNKWDYDDTSHDTFVGETKHAFGYEEPFVNQCTECHGDDLTGGTTGRTCFACHFEKFDLSDPSHDTDIGKAWHAVGYDDPTNDTCIDCHGTDLKGSAFAQSCYQCHLETWNLPESHAYEEHGILHPGGLEMNRLELTGCSDLNPCTCQECHGLDLNGSETAQSCYGYGCHRVGPNFDD
ncbi:MAG: hypothetical protein OEY59_02440 [Deltaproteobacteria bacterium]|nr:hypothetical protein [Deltaproteobacteria bacterium]